MLFFYTKIFVPKSIRIGTVLNQSILRYKMYINHGWNVPILMVYFLELEGEYCTVTQGVALTESLFYKGFFILGETLCHCTLTTPVTKSS
ncbi:hypothetical protein D1872_275830 [compost metagenome]